MRLTTAFVKFSLFCELQVNYFNSKREFWTKKLTSEDILILLAKLNYNLHFLHIARSDGFVPHLFH